MSRVLVILGMFLLTSCGQSHEEKKDIAAVSCSIMSETRDMDAAVRVREANNAREKIGGEPFLRGDDAIIESFEWGLCHELVLNDNYDETLQFLKDTKRERERIAEEKRAEERRIADSKPTVKEEFYDNGNLESRINYQPKIEGGKQHGLTEHYYENGQSFYQQNYKDGKEEDGLTERYHENGKLWVEVNYKDGKVNGLIKSYHENGKLSGKRNYKDGEETGLSETYHQNGKLFMKTNYKDGKRDGLDSWYRKDGELQHESNYKEGKQDGLYTFYATGGGILFEKCYKSDTETLMSYCEK